MTSGDDRDGLAQALDLAERGEFRQARAILEILSARYPEVAEIAEALGAVLFRAGEAVLALPHFLCAARLRGRGDGHWLFHTLRAMGDAGDLDGALALHRSASDLLLDRVYLPSLAVALLPQVARSTAEMERARDAFEAAVRALDAAGGSAGEDELPALSTAFIDAFQGRPNREAHERIAAFYARLCPSLRYVSPRGARADRGRIRVGFVSGHFYNHTIGKLFLGFVAHLDRARFEVSVFSTRPPDDELGRLFAQRADSFAVLPKTLAAARAQIDAAQLDVLFYPDIGMEPFTYFLAFSRLAPVQCTSWGHPVTTGIDTLDYFISSYDIEAPDEFEAQALYSERLIRLSTLPTYLYPLRGSPDAVGPDLSSFAGATIYTCVQQPMKIHPDFDRLVVEILRRDPNGVALFIDYAPRLTEILRARLFAAAADQAHRIHFLPRLRQNDFLELLKASHVILDTILYSGGISTAEAFSVGKPVVTWPHPSFMAGRVTLGYCRQIGVEDCVAIDADDYVEKALRLGTDAAFRATVEKAVRERRDRIFRQERVVRELEDFFERAVAGVSPSNP